ncbi:MAG: DNA polymerase/3'-5' exonuclease PolX [Candidatus Micrarchaeia archaeon]
MYNKLIADMFNEIAALLSLSDDQNAKFQVRAYQKAALTIGTLQEPIEDIYRNGGKEALMKLPGIGSTLADRIIEYIETGKISKLEKLRKKYPIDIKGLTALEGMGARKAVQLYKELGVKNIDDLKDAIAKHRIRGLKGFGERSEEVIAKNLALLEQSKGRILLGDALPVAEKIVEFLKKSGLVEQAEIAGSTRRMRETVGDIDILALSKKQEQVMDLFTSMDDVSSVISKGPTKTTVWLKIGVSCDLRVIEPESFSAALQYFTGSKDHNIEVRKIAIKNGFKLNEYGLFKNGKAMKTPTEQSIYEMLGMEWMPPEMRESRGEIKLALEHKIPKLVEIGDIKGDMHTHTNETDGANTIEQMAEAAKAMGYEYFATTNHTKSLKVAHGMNESQFKRFFDHVDKIQDRYGIKIFKGAEVDILPDGSLDLSDKMLKSMDCVVAAVHSHFGMSEEDMTKRVVKALDSHLVNILAHPTGRVLLEREPYKINLEKVFEAAERNGVALEVNAFPNRLDLNDTNIMLASNYRVKFSIDTDAHRLSHLEFMKYGVGTARRGWLEKSRVINTMRLYDMEKFLSK